VSRPAPAPATIRAGQTALLWRLGLLLIPVGAALLPWPWNAGLLVVWGGAALVALLYRLTTVPVNAAALWVPPAPLFRPLTLLGVALYGALALAVLGTGSLLLASNLLPPLVGLSLAVLLPGHDTALATRTWALAVAGAGWALTGTLAMVALADGRGSGVPPLLILVLALAGWSAGRRALLIQGLRVRLADGLALILGLTAIVITSSGNLLPLVVGFIVGTLIALGAARLLPTTDTPTTGALIAHELVSVYHQLVFITPLTWLALQIMAIYS
jgi:hypothetical protein